MAKLTNKQQRFIEEYLLDLNATQAAIRAGYSASTAASIATENLRKPHIQNEIAKRLEAINSAKIADAEEVMQYLTAVLRGESESEVVVVEGTGDGHSKARKIQKAPDEKERLKAADLLGRRYALFSGSLQISGADGDSVKIEVVGV